MIVGGSALALYGVSWAWMKRRSSFPPDTTVEGAYLRIAFALGENHPAEMFAYLETEAQWACYSLHEMRGKAASLIEKYYPKEAKEAALAPFRELVGSSDGPDVFVRLANSRGWLKRLRKDLSGIARVEIDGPRASVETARGTRYPFRRRDNGIWGMTLFTAELTAEAEKAARDMTVIESSAKDYAGSNFTQ